MHFWRSSNPVQSLFTCETLRMEKLWVVNILILANLPKNMGWETLLQPRISLVTNDCCMGRNVCMWRMCTTLKLAWGHTTRLVLCFNVLKRYMADAN